METILDEGSTSNNISYETYKKNEHLIGMLEPSNSYARLASNSHLKSYGRCTLKVAMGRIEEDVPFEVYNSRGGWEVILGKPWKNGGIHYYETGLGIDIFWKAKPQTDDEWIYIQNQNILTLNNRHLKLPDHPNKVTKLMERERRIEEIRRIHEDKLLRWEKRW